MIKKILLFALVTLLALIVAIPALYSVKINGNNLLGLASRNPVKPGGFGFTLQRFQDIENFQDIDVVMIGSSHAYRTYDPRVFKAYGLKAFNLGTTGQTPLNSYYLLKRYLPQLKPTLVIIDLVYRVMDRDGLECFYDLSSNMTYAPEFREMAISIGNPHGYQQLVNMWMRDQFGGGISATQKRVRGEAYVPGGLVEFTRPDPLHLDSTTKELVVGKKTLRPRQKQLDYVIKIVQLLRQKNIGVVLVTKPEPAGNLTAITNYEAVSQTFQKLADEANVTFFDFNQKKLPLTFREHFQEREYLSEAGLAVFNPILIETLAQNGYFSDNPNFKQPSLPKSD